MWFTGDFLQGPYLKWEGETGGQNTQSLIAQTFRGSGPLLCLSVGGWNRNLSSLFWSNNSNGGHISECPLSVRPYNRRVFLDIRSYLPLTRPSRCIIHLFIFFTEMEIETRQVKWLISNYIDRKWPSKVLNPGLPLPNLTCSAACMLSLTAAYAGWKL